MNCTGKIVQGASWKVGNFIYGKIEEKSLSRGGFGTHGRATGSKNFFFGLIMRIKVLWTDLFCNKTYLDCINDFWSTESLVSSIYDQSFSHFLG